MPNVTRRLKAMRGTLIPGIAPLEDFGWAGETLRLVIHEIPRANVLDQVWDTLSAGARSELIHKLAIYVESWARFGFIHGDLSPNNILIESHIWNKTLSGIWFTDWILDLNSFEGTPLFSAPEAYFGVRTPSSDRHSLNRIIEYFAVKLL